MILRTFRFLGVGLGLGLLLVWNLSSNLVLCSCVSPQCLITSEGRESLTHSTEGSRRPIPVPIGLGLSEIKRDDHRLRPRSLHASFLNTSLERTEGKINQEHRPKIQAEPVPRPRPRSTTPTDVLLHSVLNVDRQIQVVPNAFNTTVDHIQAEDIAKSLYKLNTAALLRGFYVFGGLGAMVVMYILVRTIRLRRTKTTVRRYGILTNREDVEMTPLGADDDEDTTIFEVNAHTRT